MPGRVCPSCGKTNGEGQWGCSACGASLYPLPDQDPTSPRKSCTACGGPTEAGWVQFQAGSFGEVPVSPVLRDKDGAKAVTLQAETCTACGHIDLYQA